MRQVNFEEIIKNADKRRSTIQAVVDNYAEVERHLTMLQGARNFLINLGTLYQEVDTEGKVILLESLAAGTSFGAVKLNEALATLKNTPSQNFDSVLARLRTVSEAITAKV